MSNATRPASEVRSRAQLEDYLGQSLLSEYFDTSGRRPRQLSTSLKTYLVELHTERVGPEELARGRAFASVRRTDEDDLWQATDENGIAYFLDVADGRFAFMHTVGHTNVTDQAWRRLTSSVPHADNCWIPSRMLEGIRLGQVIGFRLFSQSQMKGLDVSDEAQQLARDLGKDHPPAFRLQVSDWATAERDLATFRGQTAVGRRAAIQSINWRERGARVTDEEGADFIHDEVWSTGKVTGYGTSWTRHLGNLRVLRQSYRRMVSGIEEELTIRWAEGEGLQGAPIVIAFEGLEVADLVQLGGDLVNGADPFRLLGTVERVTDRLVALEAIDLHTGGRLQIELTPDELRIYLRTGTCGNVVPRFLVNFEHYLTATLDTSIDSRLVAQ